MNNVLLVELGLLVLLLGVFYRRKKVYNESLYAFKTLCSFYNIGSEAYGLMVRMGHYAQVLKPHAILSSLRSFEKSFTEWMKRTDQSKRLFPLKPHLLYLYQRVADRLRSFDERPHERRKLPRLSFVTPVYIRERGTEMHEGLLMNISGGGVRMMSKKLVKKGQRIHLGFDQETVRTITARVLDVVKKKEFCIIRAKFSYIYP